jgi:hypothetical protein
MCFAGIMFVVLLGFRITDNQGPDFDDIIFVVISRHGSTAYIYFHQRKCTHNKSYLIQHCCSRQPPTCTDYRKLGNACCRKAHFCIGRNSFPTFILLSGMLPSSFILQAHNIFLVTCVLISIVDAIQ